jgi:hypothetical protein
VEVADALEVLMAARTISPKYTSPAATEVAGDIVRGFIVGL